MRNDKESLRKQSEVNRDNREVESREQLENLRQLGRGNKLAGRGEER